MVFQYEGISLYLPWPRQRIRSRTSLCKTSVEKSACETLTRCFLLDPTIMCIYMPQTPYRVRSPTYSLSSLTSPVGSHILGAISLSPSFTNTSFIYPVLAYQHILHPNSRLASLSLSSQCHPRHSPSLQHGLLHSSPICHHQHEPAQSINNNPTPPD